jgi:DNA-binding CsgD family transcriptional regulator
MMTKPLSKEIIQRIRDEVLSGKNKFTVSKELGISKSAVYSHTVDIPGGNQGKTLSKETLKKIREEILQGKSKYQISREMNLSSNTVYKNTKDLPSKHTRDPYISGKPLELLKQLLKKGFIYTEKNGVALRSLQRHFPVIRRSQYKRRSIYYLEDKNKTALREMMKQNRSRIINYYELKSVCKVFNTDISISEKKQFFGKNRPRSRKRKYNFKKAQVFFPKEKQSLLDDFFGRFLHSEVLQNSSYESPYQRLIFNSKYLKKSYL